MIDKRGKTQFVPSCPPAARSGYVPARDARARPSPCRANTQEWRAEVVAQASFSWPFGPIHLLAPYEKSTAAQAAPLPVGSGHPPHLAGAVPYKDLSVSA